MILDILFSFFLSFSHLSVDFILATLINFQYENGKKIY